jgi:hypothetical protein
VQPDIILVVIRITGQSVVACCAVCSTESMMLLQLLAKDRRPQDAKLVHVRSSGLKAAATWHRVEILQVENCGHKMLPVGMVVAWLR